MKLSEEATGGGVHASDSSYVPRPGREIRKDKRTDACRRLEGRECVGTELPLRGWSLLEFGVMVTQRNEYT